VRISDVSAAIQEAMESYEVEIGGRTFPVKAVRNLTGHNIKQHRIHGGKSIPFVKNSDQTKMEEGEVFAIETFGSTGSGYVYDDVRFRPDERLVGAVLITGQIGIYGYGLHQDAPLRTPVSLASAKNLHKRIRENFGTLVFCRRDLDRLGVQKYLAAVSVLVPREENTCMLTGGEDELSCVEWDRRTVSTPQRYYGLIFRTIRARESAEYLDVLGGVR